MKNKKNGNTPSKIPIFINQAEFEKNLPKTVEVLKTKEGNKVFVVGTVHFSLKSRDDVSVTIRNTKPSVVMLELCPLRKYILEIDEETLLKEASTLDSEKIKEIISSKGLVNGMFYVSFLKTNASITRQLGVAPGGECRRAVHECQKLNNCKVILGDRPIDITMQRALQPLTIRQKLQLSNIFTDPTISKITAEELEAYKCRNCDYLKNLRQHFPSVYRSFVTERDQILAHNLWLASKMGGNDYCNVVGVVGMGHMNGILQNFGKTTTNEIMKLMKKDMSKPRNKPNMFTIITKFLKYLGHK